MEQGTKRAWAGSVRNLLVVVAAMTSGLASAADLRAGGTGSATEMLRHLGSAFAAETEIRIAVIPDLGSGGAIRAVADGVIDLAVSSRPLTPGETAKGVVGTAFARTPFGLATSHPRPDGLRSDAIAGVFKGGQATWKDGTPVRVILRPRNDTDTPLMGALFPGLADAIEIARRRTDVPVAATDTDNAAMAERVSGSLVGMTLTQARMERRNLRLVTIDGVEPTLENFEAGTYPYGKTFHIVVRTDRSPAVDRFVAFVTSDRVRSALRETGNLPVPPP